MLAAYAVCFAVIAVFSTGVAWILLHVRRQLSTMRDAAPFWRDRLEE